MRHALANALYALAEAVDRPVQRCEGGKLRFGDESGPRYDAARTSYNINVHAREASRISGDFHPPEYGSTYAALHVDEVTVFLSRRTTLALLHVLRGMERAFAKHGEGRR